MVEIQPLLLPQVSNTISYIVLICLQGKKWMQQRAVLEGSSGLMSKGLVIEGTSTYFHLFHLSSFFPLRYHYHAAFFSSISDIKKKT